MCRYSAIEISCIHQYFNLLLCSIKNNELVSIYKLLFRLLSSQMSRLHTNDFLAFKWGPGLPGGPVISVLAQCVT